MSCNCHEPTEFQCTGPGSEILTNPVLTWLKTTDSLYGTTDPDVPDGNLNQLFWKLLQNDCSIVHFINNAFSRTFGVFDGPAPEAGTVPNPLPGAPTEPQPGAVHTVIFNDFEVTYQFDTVTGEWVEVARMPRSQQVAEVHQAKVTIALEEGSTEGAFTIPTQDDNSVAFPFTIDDLSIMYINNLDTDAPFVGIVPGVNLSGAVVRVALSSPIPSDSDYELVAVFRHTSLH